MTWNFTRKCVLTTEKDEWRGLRKPKEVLRGAGASLRITEYILDSAGGEPAKEVADQVRDIRPDDKDKRDGGGQDARVVAAWEAECRIAVMSCAVPPCESGARTSFTPRAQIKAWSMRMRRRLSHLSWGCRFELLGNLKLYTLDPVINGYAPFHCASLMQSAKFEFYHRKGRNAR